MTYLSKRHALAALALGTMVLATGAALAEGLTARTSTAEVAQGDTFQLMLSGDAGTLTAAPDLTPLAADFDVLGTGQSRQTQIVNGARSDSLQWTVTLAPKSQGALTIPVLHAGAASSDPVQIDVLDPAAMPAVTVPGAPEVAVTLGQGTHYVQQEIPLQVSITAGPNLQSGELVLPQSPDFTLTQSDEDQVTQTNTNSGPVTTTTRTYMLRPQTDGTLTVPPITLKAMISDPNSSGPFSNSPFEQMFAQFPGRRGGNDPFARMFNPGREVAVRSAPITLEVKANPAGQTSWFLPAKDVQISAEWQPSTPVFKTGEAVTRKIRITALGATETQLPDITIGAAQGLRIYPEGSQARSVDTPDGTAAVREFSFSIVPTAGGTLTVPQVKVDWFNTTTETAQSAVLPAETITVEGAALVAPASVQVAATQTNVTTPIQNTGISFWWWVVGVIVLIGGAVAIWARKPTHKNSEISGAQHRRVAVTRARTAAQKGNLKDLHAAVGTWLKHAGQSQGGTEQFPDLMAHWQGLEHTLYADSATRNGPFDSKGIVAALVEADRVLTAADKRKNKRGNVLGPLYRITQHGDGHPA